MIKGTKGGGEGEIRVTETLQTPFPRHNLSAGKCQIGCLTKKIVEVFTDHHLRRSIDPIGGEGVRWGGTSQFGEGIKDGCWRGW